MTFQEILKLLKDKYVKQGDQRDKGTAFEILVKKFLLTDEMYKSQYKDVFLVGDMSLNLTDKSDIGIDLLARNNDDEWVSVQCKFYDENKSISKEDIAKFLSISRLNSVKFGAIEIKQRLFVDTSTKEWSKNIEKLIEANNIPINRISIKDFEESSVDWSSVVGLNLDDESYELKTNNKKRLRPHQSEAIKAIKSELNLNDRTKLIMACGTGKSPTAIRLADDLVGGGEIGIFFAPSIALIAQALKEFHKESLNPLKSFVVCSDTKVGKDKEDMSILDLPATPTTDAKILANHINHELNLHHKIIIFSTYQSIDATASALKILNKSVKLIICDEAHRTAGFKFDDNDESSFTKVHNNKFIKATYRVYMTATPKIYKSKESTRDDEITLFSMDDEKIFGKVAYQLSFKDALEKNLLSDYKVIITIIDKKEVADIANQITFVSIENKNGKTQNFDIDIKLAGQIVATYKSINKKDILIINDKNQERPLDEDIQNAMRRSIAFNSSIQNSKGRVKAFNEIIKLANLDGLECELKHIDGVMNSQEKGILLSWLKQDDEKLKILSNARCLTEGVDVSNLDSVIFYDARNSIVDIIQAIGRVMRKSEGKKYGYVILPVVLDINELKDSNISEKMANHEAFKGVWKILAAIRSHDDRLVSERYIEDLIKVAKTSAFKSYGLDNSTSTQLKTGIQCSLSLIELTTAIKNVIPDKIGDKYYWSTFAKNVAEISKNLLLRIEELLKNDEVKAIFIEFVSTLRKNINDTITEDTATEMLTQHIITKPIFDALYGKNEFGKNNPVAISLQNVYKKIEKYGLNSETGDLVNLYKNIEENALLAKDDPKSKQNIIRNLYDTFFQAGFKKMSEKLGIVYTPIEVVDFIIHSVNFALKKHFNRSLNHTDTHILDPFTGTGTFITRLLQSGLINSNLEHKFNNEIHANEIVLLAYYIANLNIAATYEELTKTYAELGNLCLTDTFAMLHNHLFDDTCTQDGKPFSENSKRIKRQKELKRIDVIIGNPPYSAGQKNANDNNQNTRYEALEQRFKDTYIKHSTAQRNNIDSYKLALRWASDRIDGNGVIGFVTNASFIDGNSDDGLRYCLEHEFSYIYILNLRGNIRKNMRNKESGEGGNIFNVQVPAAITILIKDKNYKEQRAKIYYHDIGDNISKQTKLDKLMDFKSIQNVKFKTITPDSFNDWINQRDTSFDKFIAIADKDTKLKDDGKEIFRVFSSGVITSRDFWAYNFSKENLSQNIKNTINFYNGNLGKKIIYDSKKIKWTDDLIKRNTKKEILQFDESKIRLCLYRPFSKAQLYYDTAFNERQCRLDKFYPADTCDNLAIITSGLVSGGTFSALITNMTMDRETLTKCQNFPLYYYEENKNPKANQSLFEEFEPKKQGSLFENQNTKYTKKYAIRDYALNEFKKAYKDESISKEDIFYYIYGLFHSNEYKNKYADNLSKQLPRIPFCKDFWQYAKVGRNLANLHLNYENFTPQSPAKIVKSGDEKANLLESELNFTDDDYEVKKMKFARRDKKDTIIYNDKISVINIPTVAYEYKVNGKSAIEWIVDRYQIRTDADSGIVNDPNLFSDDPKYILNLLLSVIFVSVESLKIIKELPKFELIEE